MKKVEIISREQKDLDKTVLSSVTNPQDRILLMFKLMELSYYLRGSKEKAVILSDKSSVIELKLLHGAK